jgi:hypothetical protein
MTAKKRSRSLPAQSRAQRVNVRPEPPVTLDLVLLITDFLYGFGTPSAEEVRGVITELKRTLGGEQFRILCRDSAGLREAIERQLTCASRW